MNLATRVIQTEHEFEGAAEGRAARKPATPGASRRQGAGRLEPTGCLGGDRKSVQERHTMPVLRLSRPAISPRELQTHLALLSANQQNTRNLSESTGQLFSYTEYG